MAEAVVSFLLLSLSLAALVGAALAVWGFRKADHPVGDRGDAAKRLDQMLDVLRGGKLYMNMAWRQGHEFRPGADEVVKDLSRLVEESP